MMKKTSLLLLVVAVLMSSCSSKMKTVSAEYFTVTPSVLEVVGSEIPVTIDGKFPAKFFNKNSVLTITPVLKPADSPAGKGVVYLNTILDKLGCQNITITVAEIEGGSQITLTGEGLGVVIGHRGETLDALQYLVSLAANAGVSGYYRVVLNTGDFRQKREQTLIALAKRMSEQAIRSGKCRTLEPMNPYERRIIHTTVQAIDGVISTSFGEGSGRRVVIAPEGKEPRPRNDYRRGGSGRGRNDRRSGRKEAYKPEINPDRTPVKDAGALPLYGRIDK